LASARNAPEKAIVLYRGIRLGAPGIYSVDDYFRRKNSARIWKNSADFFSFPGAGRLFAFVVQYAASISQINLPILGESTIGHEFFGQTLA